MIVLTRENANRVIKSYGGVEISPVSSPDRGLVLGIYGPGGVGKTTLAATITDAADNLGSPALLLNARGNPHVISSYAGKIDIADITRFDQVEKIRADMLRDKSLEYKSVIIDNVTELWSMDLRDRYGPMTTVEWTKHSASTSDIMQLVRNWIDMAEIGPKLNVIFVFQETPETRDIRGRTGVIVSEVAFNKALQSHVPSLVNFLGRLYIHTDQPPYRRVLDFRPIDTMHQAKLQVDRDDQYAKQIPFEVYDPSLASILDTVRGHKPWPTEKHAAPQRGRGNT
jgi:GTPase SAR1 family protein